MSLNTKKQRINLYQKTFLKWDVKQRLSELERTLIDTALAVHQFSTIANDNSFNTFCEKTSDLETMLEVAKESFPLLQQNAETIQKIKLQQLKKKDLSNQSQKTIKLKPKSIDIENIINRQNQTLKKSKGLKQLFRF